MSDERTKRTGNHIVTISRRANGSIYVQIRDFDGQNCTYAYLELSEIEWISQQAKELAKP